MRLNRIYKRYDIRIICIRDYSSIYLFIYFIYIFLNFLNKDATKQSTAKGKDASSCYETARARLREYSLTGFSDLDSCRNEALSSASQTQENMQSTVLVS